VSAEESIYRSEGGRYVAGAYARGPWDANAQHGGAPAALVATLLERMPHAPELRVARLGFELLRPIPFEPLSIESQVIRDGRRVQELAAEVRAGDRLICRACALRVACVPDEVPAGEQAPDDEPPMPGPDGAAEVAFSLDANDTPSFAGSMAMRWVDHPRTPGRARVWMRMRRPLLDGERPSSLANLAATADFGNGVSAVLDFERFVFINADLSIHLHRAPVGDWTGLNARTLIAPGGVGTAESVLHDGHGPVGRALQTLVVGAR
jgi:hypothetical protein